MIQQLDEFGRAYTTDVQTARQYRIEDRQINYHAMKNGYVPPIKHISFCTYDKNTRTYRLPPACGVGHKRGTNIDTPGELHLYGYQDEAVNFIKKCYDENKKSAMIVSGTATGKSHIIMGVIYSIHHRTVIVVPNELIAKGLVEKLGGTLNTQFLTAEKFRKATKYPEVLIILGASFNKVFNQINDYYDTIICDEGHHLSTNRKDQLNMRKGDFICMLTATPERKEYGLEGFQMYLGNIHDTEKQALPVKVYTYEYDYDYTVDEVIKAQTGLSPESPELYRRLYCYNTNRIGHLEQILLHLKGQGFKKIIVFTDRRAHIDLIQELIPNTIRITGNEDTEEFLESIVGKDEYTIIAMSQCAGEGFDLPALECGILFMSTSWNNTIDQTAGRIRRYSGEKELAYYIDFIDVFKIMGGKKKKLGRYGRSRIYKNKGRDVEPFENLLSF